MSQSLLGQPTNPQDPLACGLTLVAKGQSVSPQALLYHPTLQMHRSELAQYRVGQAGLANMDLVKSGRLTIGNSSQGEIPKVNIGGLYKFENTLSVDERIDLLSAPAVLPNTQKDESSPHPFTCAERCVLGDYIAIDGYSSEMNRFLRGEFMGDTRLHSDLRERSLILISLLNALPVKPTEAQHNLKIGSPMFKAILDAAESGQPFMPNYFLSMSKLENVSAPINPNIFGTVTCVVRLTSSKDVSALNALWPNERELIAAPISAYKVEKGPGFGDEKSDKNWFTLTEYEAQKPNT